jgi:hypothetical protein
MGLLNTALGEMDLSALSPRKGDSEEHVHPGIFGG